MVTRITSWVSPTFRRLLAWGIDFLVNPSNGFIMAVLLLLWEWVLCGLIIRFVNYTEIDWSTYMVQVKQIMNGERQYDRIQGPTGPIVYPAGHVYLFSALYHLTDGGDILQGQILFAGLYMASLALVMTLYIQCKLPPYTLLLLCLSKRIHSVFLLRMHNDTVAMLGVYIMAWCLTKQRWRAAAVWFSLALSVKMNILLFAPGLAFLLVSALGWMPALRLGLLVSVIQVVLGLPFLLTYPYEYMTMAYDFR
ncbi:dolichyl-P-Man:Man(5)GlcNAc(2)-PP-dolichol alpha-1,3-mannosyltransferase [Dispira simplex]|nr:dolichyl-P-Man:Man(5)GlcNAc(2)-PP-dolichol alpha-1,3-mannosyltransferase [Dispira simplex]